MIGGKTLDHDQNIIQKFRNEEKKNKTWYLLDC